MASHWVWLGPLLALLGLVVLLAVGLLTAWFVMSYNTFPETIRPGESYRVGDHTLEVPNLLHMVNGSDQTATRDRPLPKLPEKTLIDIVDLAQGVKQALDEAHVTHWYTGGTLLGLQVWHSFLAYDDDIDAAVAWEDRDYVWSPQFAHFLDKRGLETFFLRGMSLAWATREGAAVRVRKKGTVFPTMDIFTVKKRDDGSWCKVNAWNGDRLHFQDPRERWDTEDWLFPLRTVEAYGEAWPVGNRAADMLTRQYGDDWRTTMKSPKPLTASHRFIFSMSNWFRVWRVGEVDHKGGTNPRGLDPRA